MDDLQDQTLGAHSKAHLESTPQSLRSTPSEEPLSRFNIHRGSFSTSTTDSTDSSPTTTSSYPGQLPFVDTPGTSPDTPQAFQASSSLPGSKSGSAESKNDLRFSQTTPAARKARNLKNLALNTSRTFPLSKDINSALPTGLLEAMATPTPLSTGFVRPPPQQRRNPSLSLSIKTPVSESSHSPLPISQIPPTPSLARPSGFRSFLSSPALPTLLTNPPEAHYRNLSSAGGMTDAPAEEDDRNYEVPQSREEKLDAYPNGPICIYDSLVDLYLEPTADQAREYDVILNVASEVQNPFNGLPDWDIHSKTLHTAASELRSANVLSEKRVGPEYIHVPWEHNTDIVPDLFELVKVVDDRVRRRQRVLIHCQCGVSRSASLIVAYGIYKNPAMTVQQAYDAVKRKSRWIGPNMNLIMQLQEFRSGLIKTSIGVGRGSIRSTSRVLHGRQVGSGGSNGNILVPQEAQIPQTAPLPEYGNKHIPTPIKTEHLEKISPGPSSAPSGLSWPTEPAPPLPRPQSLGSDGSSTPTMVSPQRGVQEPVSSGQHPYPYRDKAYTSPQRKLVPRNPIHLDVPVMKSSTFALETPRSTEFAMTSVRESDLDGTFGITSPRATTFTSMPVSSEEPLMSPRSEEFAMAPVIPPEIDDTVTLGLTSPRTESFFDLPHRFGPPSPPRPHLNRPAALQPIQPIFGDTQARADLNTRLGFSNNQSEPHLPQTLSAQSASTTVSPSHVQTATSEPLVEFSDALLSPRAVEFTTNPMREALAAGPPSPAANSPENDPRSPPVRGASPITRDIFGVL